MIKRLTLFTFHRIENPYRENAKWFNGYKVSSWGDEGVLELDRQGVEEHYSSTKLPLQCSLLNG